MLLLALGPTTFKPTVTTDGVNLTRFWSHDVSWTSVIYASIVFGILALVFTIVGVYLGPPPVQVGGTRPGETIPGHLAELAGFGLVLGLGGMVIYGRRGLPLVFLIPTLSVLLDVDHLPAYLGYQQPIRPAHSLVFLAVVLAITAITIKAPAIELAMASAFMGHLAVDTGIFAPFSPFSFAYFQLDPYRWPLAASALLAALAAGIMLRRSTKSVGGETIA